MEAAPGGCVSEWNGADVAIRQQPEGLRLPLLISGHEQAIELDKRAAMFDATHFRKAQRERLQMFGLEVVHAANQKRTLRPARLKFFVVRPELVAHVIALVQRHLR